jgi:hypothetical protein
MLRLKLAKLQIDAGKRSDAKAELSRLADAGLTMNDAQREQLRTMLGEVSR